MTLSLKLTDDAERRLAEVVGDLAAVAVRDLLAQPAADFERVAKRVMEKNRELYERLA